MINGLRYVIIKKRRRTILKKNAYYLSGLRLIAAGIFLAALVSAARAGLRAWQFYAYGEFGAQVLLLISWLFILGGVVSMAGYRPEFARVRLTAVVCVVLYAGAIALSFYNYRAGMDSQTFVEIKVVLLEYLAAIGMLYTYYNMMKGLAAVGGKTGQSKFAKACRDTYKPVIITVIIMMVLEPAASIFPEYVEWAVTGICAVISFVFVMRIFALINKGYGSLNGRGARS